MHEAYFAYLYFGSAFFVLTAASVVVFHPQLRLGNILFAIIAATVVGILWLLAIVAALGSLIIDALGLLEQDLCHEPYLFASDPPKTHEVKNQSRH